MQPIRAVSTVLLGLVATGSAVFAAQAPKEVIDIWRASEQASIRDSFFVDYDPATPGLELIGLTQNCSRSAPDGNGHVKTTVKTRFVTRTAAGAVRFNPTTIPTVVSGSFPDPTAAAFDCDGPNATAYETEHESSRYMRDTAGTNFNGNCSNTRDPNDGDGPSGLCGVFPDDFFFGIGMANGAGVTRSIVIGDAVRGSWSNNLGSSDAGAYAIHVYNPATSARVWTKSFVSQSADGYLESQCSGVGDFLNDDGEDELRICRVKSGGTSDTFRYVYYDIDNGNAIGAPVSFTVPIP